ncbi:ABC transporter substrate-binding protein [Actinomadura mexicana]|uniref:Carbohydrate ABC transporter substrate-binding protein, CUT1 family n=1 Tax=Actinomadura mexicana TaxID=134959 RepID=A0A238XFP6_9ACTN|nr:extracellular solute-binding protein [Actinomadura mexicana]SNR57323.1 carbohydrate ABC transporter substrate-binding protein, CUT1 family [Actinomadura mexicana]
MGETQLGRRRMLQGLAAVAASGMVGGLTGCSGASGADAVTAWSYRPEYRAAIDKIVAAFIKANPEVKVDMGFKPSAQYPTLLKTALVGESAPDAIATNGANGIWGDMGADGGYILPLDGKVQLQSLRPAVAKAVQYRGHTYGSPVQIFKIGVYYQRQIFAKYGLTPPKTWDDLLRTSRTLASRGVTAWSMPAQDMIMPSFMYHLAASSILDTAGYEDLRTGKRKLTDPDLLPAAQLLIDLSRYYNRGYQAVAYAEGKALFAQGRTAMIVGGSSDYAGFVEVNPKLDVGFFGFPTPENTGPNIAITGLSMAYVVNKASKHADLAATFVSWLSSAEAQQLVLDNLGLPARQGMTPQGSGPRSQLMNTILQVRDNPSWLDHPDTGNVTAALAKGGAGIFSGKLTAAQFAKVAQEAVKPMPES